MKGILGKKLGMTQIFTDDEVVPATLVEAGPCFIVQVKTSEKDGYGAYQIGYEARGEKYVNKPQKGHFSKARVRPLKYLAELPLGEGEEYKVGQKITADIFAEGEMIDVSGVTKGKGFAGVVKRWGFGGGPGSHGSHFHRITGAIGQCASPSRVFKGRKMPGRLGDEKVTIQNLEVVRVDNNRNLILIRGSVPGGKGSLLMMRTTVKPVKFKQRKKREEPPAESHKRKAKGKEEKEAAETEAKEKTAKKGQEEEKGTQDKKTASQEASTEAGKQEAGKDKAKDTKGEKEAKNTQEEEAKNLKKKQKAQDKAEQNQEKKG